MDKQHVMFNKTLVIGILVLLFGMSFIPSTSGDIVKNNEDVHISESDTSSSSKIDWWPMFQHDPQNTGNTTSTAPNTCYVKWYYEMSSEASYVIASPTVVDGKLYIGSWDGYLYCLDANFGTKIWSIDMNDTVDTAPAFADGKLYIGHEHFVYCLNANDGTQIWEYQAESKKTLWSHATVVDGKVYIGSHRMPWVLYGKVFCLDANDGTKIWEYKAGGGVSTTPAVADGKVFFGVNHPWNGKLICLNASNGKWIWTGSTGSSYLVESSPTVVDGKVYYGCWDGYLYCLEAETGYVKWKSGVGQIGLCSPAVVDGKVYIGSGEEGYVNYFYCFDAYDGSRIWEYKTSEVLSSPAVADGKVYFGTFELASIGPFLHRGKLVCLDANNGDELWTYLTNSGGWLFGRIVSSPAVADGKVYTAGSMKGMVYCFSDKPTNVPTITGPTGGKPGVPYTYDFTYTEPDGDDVSYYIDWNDGNFTNWTAFQASGTPYTESHIWNEDWRAYIIKAKARNTQGDESDWGTFTVSIPRSRASCSYNPLLLRFLVRFPILERLLGLIRAI